MKRGQEGELKIPSYVKGLLLALYSGVTPDVAQGNICGARMEPGWPLCKKSTLTYSLCDLF